MAIGSIWRSIAAGRNNAYKRMQSDYEEGSMRLVRQKLCLAWCIVASFAISGVRARRVGPESRSSGAQRRRDRLVHDDELGSEQRFHGAFPTEIFLSQAFRHPVRRKRVAEPNHHRGQSGKNFFDVVHGTGEIVLPLMDMGLIGAVRVARAQNDSPMT